MTPPLLSKHLPQLTYSLASVETNARREKLKRLLVVREIVRMLMHTTGFPFGEYKVELVPKSGVQVRGPHKDMVRFHYGEGALWRYSVKSRESSTAKTMRLLEGATLGGSQLAITDFYYERALRAFRQTMEALKKSTVETRVQQKEFQLLETILNAFSEKERIRRDVLSFIGQTHSNYYSLDNFRRLLTDINSIISAIREMDFSREADCKFREGAKKFVESAWPIEFLEAQKLVATIKETNPLKNAITDYLSVERESIGRGALEYQMHELVLDSVRGLEAALTLLNGSAQNAHQEAIDARLLTFGAKLSRICETVLEMEKKLREVKAAKTKGFEDGFLLLCEVAKLCSTVLNLIYDVYSEVKDCFKDERVAYILNPLERLFFELLSVNAEKENKIWEQLVKEFDECFKKLGKEKKEAKKMWGNVRRRIEAYKKHLTDIDALGGERTAALENLMNARDDYKKKCARAEEDLRNKLRELKDIAPIEGAVLEAGYEAVKAHVRYRLGDWMHNARHYLTTEKLVETLLGQAACSCELGRAEELIVYGKPLSEYQEQFAGWMAKLIELNAQIIDSCGKLGIANNNLFRQVERIGYLDANIHDMRLDESIDRLLRDDLEHKILRVEYDEKIEGGELVITLYSKAFPFMPEVRINSAIFRDDFVGERKDIERTAVGERFTTDDAVEHAAAYYEGQQSTTEKAPKMLKEFDGYLEGYSSAGYTLVTTYLADTLRQHAKDRVDANNPSEPFYYASHWRQRALSGVFYESAVCVENPAKLISTALGVENTLEQFFRESEFKDRFEQLDERMQTFRERHAMRAMADELHILLPFIILKEAQRFAETIQKH